MEKLDEVKVVIPSAAVFRGCSNKLNLRCGASLIHPQVALSAAHCVTGKGVFQIRAGEWNWEKETEPLPHQNRLPKKNNGIPAHSYRETIRKELNQIDGKARLNSVLAVLKRAEKCIKELKVCDHIVFVCDVTDVPKVSNESVGSQKEQRGLTNSLITL
ncbi:hypothetical protein NQ318_009340 [Aromia moschata]|uniref:Peptidase S1 domain-containing protein n=1 Tax=Aromia moschata TaxID=1265417 RepID=A0AAV8XNF5_9CUCU|nr:hypothetical protein NQ318_009340 [Aromia moschata]